LDGLRAWEFDFNEDNQVFSKEPLHNWASHPSDAFAYGCQVMEMDEPAGKEDDPRWPIKGTQTGFEVAPLNDLWKTAPKSNSGRI
jgi:phage terminase large subunit